MIGPYVKLRIPIIKKEEKKTYESCSDPSCREHKVKVETKFCALCGAKVTNTEKLLIIERELDIWEFITSLQNENFLDGNGKPIGETDFNKFDSHYVRGINKGEIVIFDDDISKWFGESGLFEIELSNSDDMIIKFRKKNEILFKKLDSLNGENTLTYHYGGVTYWS